MLAGSNIQWVRKTKSENRYFSILIPSWNNLPYLKLCVESIRKNSTFSHQIIVHINEGKDGSLDWVKEQADIDYTYSDTNIGVCYALNACRLLVDTEYLLYINDDMYVCPGWDKVLREEIEAIGHHYFYLSSTAIEPKASSACVIECDFGTDISSFNEEKLLKEFDSLEFHDWQGSTWPPNVVHISIWDLIGGYSIEFTPGFYSDPDFAMKLWKIGVRLFKGVSKSRVYHFGSKSVKRVKKNPGYYKFIAKWGVTCSTLTKYHLRRGKIFDGPLPEAENSAVLRVKNFFKRVMLIFKDLR
jgi:glycosyltransferase involved in cell wall biosynthesis